MNSGRRDRLITLLRPAITRAGDGTPVTTYIAAGQAWARKISTRHSEQAAASGQNLPIAENLWTIPWADGASVSASWRLIDDAGTTHALVAPPREIGRRTELELATQSLPAATTSETT